MAYEWQDEAQESTGVTWGGQDSAAGARITAGDISAWKQALREIQTTRLEIQEVYAQYASSYDETLPRDVVERELTDRLLRAIEERLCPTIEVCRDIHRREMLYSARQKLIILPHTWQGSGLTIRTEAATSERRFKDVDMEEVTALRRELRKSSDFIKKLAGERDGLLEDNSKLQLELTRYRSALESRRVGEGSRKITRRMK